MSVFLSEMSVNFCYQNYQLKSHLKEGEEYMLIDSNIHSFWAFKYGKLNEIKRFGITDETGEQVVEIYLKRFNLYTIPNKALFKFSHREESTGYEAFTQPIYMSKCSSVEDLGKKICRVLSTYLYMVIKNKTVMVKNIRLWKSNYEEADSYKEIKDLEKKYGNYTHVKLDGDILNINDE